jgi:beta-galactosidase
VGDERQVRVPHTWNDEDAVDPAVEYERDEKLYRREVGPIGRTAGADAGASDRRYLLHFEGANQVATVRIDGERVGVHRGGYTAFTFDVTDYLSGREPSTLEVAVDNTHDPDIPPLSMDYTFFGGLYRPVWLVETGAVHLDGSDYGTSGVLVDTPTVRDGSATVRARATIANRRSEPVDADVVHRVRDESGTVAAECGTTVTVGADDRETTTVTGELVAPRRWDIEDPHCYTVETTVRVGEAVTDWVESPLGVRELDVDDRGQVRLNGDPVALRGTNRHQDRAGLGNALSYEDHLTDFELIAELGANFLRLAHYPQPTVVHRAADDAGVLLWEEIPVVNYVTDNETFDRRCREMLREMVRQGYNHPSVGIWGLMNEILLHYDKPEVEGVTEGMVEAARALADELHDLARAEDPSRLTGMACHFSGSYAEFGFVDVPDVLGWNVYLGWYGGELEDIAEGLDDRLEARPGQATVVSEYGVGADPRLHDTEPDAWDFTEEYSARYHREYIRTFDRKGTTLAGTAQWNAFDFVSGRRDDTIPDRNQKGLMTHDRRPKNTYHLYRAWLSDEPVVHVATRNWARRSTASASQDGTHRVTVVSNQPAVELVVDGDSLGTQPTGDDYATDWSVPLASGDNEIVARAYAGEENTTGTGVDAPAGGSGDPVAEDRVTVELVPVAVDATGTVPPAGLSIDVGSDREILANGTLWVPDRSTDDPDIGWSAVGGERISTLDRLYGTDLVPLYQQALVGIDAYRLSIPPGTYRVDLRWCELKYDEAGRRVFSVLANGEPIVEELDPYGRAGRREPVSVTRKVAVGADGLLLEFEPEVGRPILNALRVERVDRD